jgi:hypothetical protein
MYLTTDQSKHIDFVNQFRDIRKMSSKIMQNIIPKIFDQGGSHTHMLYVVDYEKGRLNIAVMERKEKKKVSKVSIDINAVHPLDKMDLHRQTGEMLNRDVMIVNLGIKKLEVVNENLRKHLKMRNWRIELGK